MGNTPSVPHSTSSSINLPLLWDDDIEAYRTQISIAGQSFSPVADTGSGVLIVGVSEKVDTSKMQSTTCQGSATGSVAYEDGENETLYWKSAPVKMGSASVNLDFGVAQSPGSGENSVDIMGVSVSPQRNVNVNTADQILSKLPSIVTFDFKNSVLTFGGSPSGQYAIPMTTAGSMQAGCESVMLYTVQIQGITIDGKPFQEAPRSLIFDTGTTYFTPSSSAWESIVQLAKQGHKMLEIDFGSFKLQYSLSYLQEYAPPSDITSQQPADTWIFGNVCMADPEGSFAHVFSFDVDNMKMYVS